MPHPTLMEQLRAAGRILPPERKKIELWNGTVHYAGKDGRPACGSAKRTASSWIYPTNDSVTCKRCLAN